MKSTVPVVGQRGGVFSCRNLLQFINRTAPTTNLRRPKATLPQLIEVVLIGQILWIDYKISVLDHKTFKFTAV